MHRRAALLAAILSLGFPVNQAWALPTGNQLVAGAATVSSPTPTSLAITQTSGKAIINWQSFNIGAAEQVRFIQPGASSVALNRVLGADPSAIYGQLSANGQVYLVNPNGILFGPTARVDVGGLVASTLNIANAGTISANGGSAALAAGEKLTLDFDGDNLLKIKVDAAALNAQVANSGAIVADGGRVALTARAAGDLMGSVINHSGTIRATSMVKRNGEIVLDGGTRGSVAVSGTLDASGAQSASGGGSIGVFGRDIALQGASLDASGQGAGGGVLVGGAPHGAPAVVAGNPVTNARSVSMDAASAISADARSRGDGGKVVLWSDESTKFDGRISARGGPAGGNGGLVETSGRSSRSVTALA